MAVASTIALEGMHFFAHHGFYEEERLLGGEYQLDVYLDLPEPKAAQTDDLSQTINYETLYLLCEQEMKRPAHLLERVVDRIADRIKYQFQQLLEIRIRLRKLHPPLDGPVACSFVERRQNFRRACGKCNKQMTCYGDEHCWCSQIDAVGRRVSESLKAQFGEKCLCKDCLREYI